MKYIFFRWLNHLFQIFLFITPVNNTISNVQNIQTKFIVRTTPIILMDKFAEMDFVIYFQAFFVVFRKKKNKNVMIINSWIQQRCFHEIRFRIQFLNNRIQIYAYHFYFWIFYCFFLIKAFFLICFQQFYCCGIFFCVSSVFFD